MAVSHRVDGRDVRVFACDHYQYHHQTVLLVHDLRDEKNEHFFKIRNCIAIKC